MRTALLAGAMLIGLAAPSFAQTDQATTTQRGSQSQAATEAQLQGLAPMVGLRGAQMGEMMRAAGPFANGAFVRVKHGDDEIDMHCPPRLQVGTCVQGATQLMRNLQELGNQSNETSQSGSSNQ